MCYNGFTTKINLFKYKRFKDGKCRYKVLYRATLNPFLSYSARYRNNLFFFWNDNHLYWGNLFHKRYGFQKGPLIQIVVFWRLRNSADAHVYRLSGSLCIWIPTMTSKNGIAQKKNLSKRKTFPWSVWGSNSRPWRYQHHALPTELTDQLWWRSRMFGVNNRLSRSLGASFYLPWDTIAVSVGWGIWNKWLWCK